MVNTFHKHEIVGAQISREGLNKVGLPKHEVDLIAKLVRNHQFYFKDDVPDKTIESWIAEMGQEAMEYQLKIRIADRLGAKSSNTPKTKYFTRIEDLFYKAYNNPRFYFFEDLDITHQDLYQAGVPGDKHNSVLHALRNSVKQDPTKNKKEVLLQLTKKVWKKNDRS